MKAFQLNRNKSGSNILEFTFVLFILLLVFLIPAINLLIFSTAFCLGQTLVSEEVSKAAIKEKRPTEESVITDLKSRLDSPIWSCLNVMKLTDDDQSCELEVVVIDLNGTTRCHNANYKLPETLRPQYRDNLSKLSYSYNLKVKSTIKPLFNVSSVPVVNQVPVLGSPTIITFQSMAPVEHLEALNR